MMMMGHSNASGGGWHKNSSSKAKTLQNKIEKRVAK
jgi:hypothetical protein